MSRPEWISARLAECVSSVRGGVSVNSDDRQCGPGEIGVLKTSAISGGYFRPDENKVVLNRDRTRVAEPILGGSILFSRMNTPQLVGESCFVESDNPRLFLPDRLWQVKVESSRIDARWLSYVLLEPRVAASIKSIATGTSGSMKNISKSSLLNIQVSVPPLKEQQRIAEILEGLDGQIRCTEQIVAKLKLARQGLLDDLLNRGVDSNGKLRDPRLNRSEFRETALGLLPREWRISTCAALSLDIVVGIVIRPAQYYRSAGIPVLRSANVRESGLEIHNVVYMSLADHAAMSKSAVKPGDLVTVRTGYPGTTAVIPESLQSANCVDVIITRPGPQVRSDYLARWINSDLGKGQVLRVQGGLAQQHFNVSEMQALLIAVPPLAEQAVIADRTSAADQRLEIESGKLMKLADLKRGLIADLLTGRVRVPVEDAS